MNYILSADDDRFLNHSDNPNMQRVKDLEDEELANIASRDIQAGEELTGDYREFDADPFYGFEKVDSLKIKN